jgi:predicted GNAT superfamily acetyltransferase
MGDASANLIIRELASVAELKQAEAFQRLVWGEDDPVDNSDLMLAIQHEGGLVAGAFQNERMLGFLFAFPCVTTATQHSHRLAVHPASRGMGLGAKLKWYQRDWCLERKISMVRWTYDPLLSVNATLNITRLGATAGIYHENYYGEMLGINAGVPSDRLLAEWRLDDPAVVERATTGVVPPARKSDDARYISIPCKFSSLMKTDLTQASAERLRVRCEMQTMFSQGYRLIHFDRQTHRYQLLRIQG